MLNATHNAKTIVASLVLSAGLAFAGPQSHAVGEGPRSSIGRDTFLLVEYEPIARAYAGTQLGVAPEDLVLDNSARTRFATTNAVVYEYKYRDPAAGGASYSLALDKRGNPVDYSDYGPAERDARRAKYGDYSPRLAEHVDANPGPYEVIMWLKGDRIDHVEIDGFDSDDPIGNGINLYKEAQIAALDDQVLALQAPVLNLLQARGLQPEGVPMVPAVLVTVPNAIELDLLTHALDPDNLVWYVDLADTWTRDTDTLAGAASGMIDSAYFYLGFDHLHAWGYDGSGEKMGQMELLGGDVDTSFAPLSHVNQAAFWSCLRDDHAQLVASVAASRDAAQPGAANGAQYFSGGSCGTSNVGVVFDSAEAIRWGADVLNHSWSDYNSARVPTSDDRMLDCLVLHSRTLQVTSAGNGNTSRTWRIPATARGYNMIAVGSFDHVIESVSSFSCFVDPTSSSGDREKPEVTAPGDKLSFPNGRTGVNGTSFSSPYVAAFASTLHDMDKRLRIWPETTKALIMATATNNIEGERRLSDLDGAGGINPTRAFLSNSFYDRGYGCVSSYKCETSSKEIVVDEFFANPNERARVVICWGQNTSYWDYENRPSADVDLYIEDAAGRVVASSTSFDNSYEIVSFLPDLPGTYTIIAKRKRCAMSPYYLGWAWHTEPIIPPTGP